jgi:hypothetical protein
MFREPYVESLISAKRRFQQSTNYANANFNDGTIIHFLCHYGMSAG